MTNTLLEVDNLKKHFPIKSGFLRKETGSVKAVDGITFTINEGETLGLVGESGCGKSTTGRMIVDLLKPTGGMVNYKGKKISSEKQKYSKSIKKEIQMIFQDPFSSLNPRHRVIDAVEEPLAIHNMYTRSERKEKAEELLLKVGLSKEQLYRFPHEFSGGQRQRIGIARALALNPSLIICDEPVSALDVSIQSQILNLLKDLQTERKLSYLFIAHDLGVVKHISDRIAVMYLGSIVELTTKERLFQNPLHPYTKALLSSIPIEHPKQSKERIILKKDFPSPSNPPSGCKFHTRCPLATDICKEKVPTWEEKEAEHYVACHHVEISR
ncbi:dipeptide ABC transporter ATP-binding protein [Bacillus tianshenii]|nr:dipeptide ABC transporter ATP-binding protein [Bacillus tianshenii]